ncbi:MAG: NAD(P)/FAD-dependent oxidoreductase [Candidatus Neomarinimicrobiota bacterium]
MDQKIALIIGAGPAGLTAAYELLEKTNIKPIIFEKESDVGGIAKTINYKGNHIDAGGHRFFSKSDRVMEWWTNMMPIQSSSNKNIEIAYQKKKTIIKAGENRPNPDETDLVMLIRSRLSRIFYLRSFFDYPISLSLDTIKNLGVIRMIKILFSYTYAVVFPKKNENTLEDFMINRFGRELYNTFFKDYTEKVWGAKCSDISAEWGAQRIKGISITKTLIHAMKKVFIEDKSISQKGTETSLIERFFYPKFGPGQMWQETARQIKSRGGELYLNHHVKALTIIDNKVKSLTVIDCETQKEKTYNGDYFFSTMPVKELIRSMRGDLVPDDVKSIADGLVYRDFITVGLLLKALNVKTKRDHSVKTMLPDNWIYIQEPDVKVGRLQIFNNWSPYMVKDPETVWMGLEYFCNQGDELWEKSDDDFIEFAIKELKHINIIDVNDVLDSTIIRMPKTYPAYFGTYDRFNEIRLFTDAIDNLFLIGRNGMHRYNNQDHSMLTAMVAVDNIVDGIQSKDNIWGVNIEDEYHEQR